MDILILRISLVKAAPVGGFSKFARRFRAEPSDLSKNESADGLVMPTAISIYGSNGGR
jgi:hypothetical protein